MNQTLPDGLDVLTAQQRESAQQLPAPDGNSEPVSPPAPALLRFDPAEFSDRVVCFLAAFVSPDQWRTAAPVLTTLLVDVATETAALASEQYAVAMAEARAEARP